MRVAHMDFDIVFFGKGFRTESALDLSVSSFVILAVKKILVVFSLH
jgi:hypothetical protein